MLNKKGALLNFSQHTNALAIFDRFHGQCTGNIVHLLNANNNKIVIVSPNCTDIKCQTGKGFSKKAVSVMVHTRPSFRNLKQGKKEAIDVRMSVVKPLSAKWMIRLYDYMRSNPDIIANGFSPAGITFDDRCLYVIIHKLKCVKCFSNYSCGKKVTRLSSKN